MIKKYGGSLEGNFYLCYSHIENDFSEWAAVSDALVWWKWTHFVHLTLFLVGTIFNSMMTIKNVTNAGLKIL